MQTDLTRRNFLGTTAKGSAALAIAGTALPASINAADPPVTLILINEEVLRRKFPNDATALMNSVKGFATRNNGVLLDVGRERNPRTIKARLIQHSPRPKRLVIFGDEESVPRFPVKTRGVDIPIDSFYGDLDRDGFVEGPVTRVLGSARAMMNQLKIPAPRATHSLNALYYTANELRSNIEFNVMSRLLAERGYIAEVSNWGDPTMLAETDMVLLGAHGDPNGWYGGALGPFVTTATVPELPRRPIIWAGACSTATPGAPILTTFMEKGCRVYVGAVSDSYGWTTCYLGNELFLHLVDSMREYPDMVVAELVSEARNRFVDANRLATTLVKLENGEAPEVDEVLAHTALQWQVFGDITTTCPRTQPIPLSANHSLTVNSSNLRAGGTLSIRFEVKPTDGAPMLFFQSDWDRSVSKSLELEILQNGNLLHKLDWKEQREWPAYTDTANGGYWNGDRYMAYALVPLMRRTGMNEAVVRLARASQPIVVSSKSELQLWPKREPPHPLRQTVRQSGINVLLLSIDDNIDPLVRALRVTEHLQFDHHVDLGSYLAPYEFPDDPRQSLDLGRYDVIILDEMERGYKAFPRGLAARTREFVRQGGGLIMTGGTLTFGGKEGRGGYGGTPFEEMLPVRILSSNDVVDNGPFKIGPITEHPILAGIDCSRFPSMRGYNRVAAKPQSTVVMRTQSGDPLLVVGQFGKGRVVAYTSAFGRGWGRDFPAWPYYSRFWANLVRWASAVPMVDLSGVWRANDGTYTIKQSGPRLSWEGVSSDGGKAWTHTFNGDLQHDLIVGNYVNHPPGAARGGGKLSVRVINDNRLEKAVSSDSGFGGNVWTR